MSYIELGREEDPDFTIKTMVVQTNWPGATIEDTINLVTDPIEKKLEEVPYLDYVKSYTKPGSSVVYVNLKDYTPPEVIPDLWYQVRKKIADIEAHPAAGRPGAGLQRRVRRHLRHSLRLHRRRVQLPRAEGLRRISAGRADAREGRRQDPVRRHPGREDLPGFLDAPARRLGIDRDQVIADLQAQNAVAPAGVVQAGAEKFTVRVSGEFTSEESLARDQPARQRQVLPAGRRGAGPARLRRSAVSRSSATTASPPSA